MATEKQIQANRLNGLKGGVKTPEGKAVSRWNALSHGFYSSSVLLFSENHFLMNEYREKFYADLKPVGAMETILVERIIASSWRLNRVLQTEKKFNRNGDGVDYRYSVWEKVSRLETTLERQIYKALHELQNLQKARFIAASALADLSANSSSLDPE